jgi:hypothetical protein
MNIIFGLAALTAVILIARVVWVAYSFFVKGENIDTDDPSSGWG